MTTAAKGTNAGSNRTTLKKGTVAAAMHRGVMACDPDATLHDVAAMLTTHHVHCIAVMGVSREPGGETLMWHIISDVDVIAAGLHGESQAARTLGGRPINGVEPAMPLAEAAELMLRERTSHLVVVDPQTQHPVGVLSTLDVVAALAR
jgi:CBS domain-containing protein